MQGITMAGVGLANLIVPLFSASITQALNWRAAYFALGSVSLVGLIPLLLVVPPRRRDGAKDPVNPVVQSVSNEADDPSMLSAIASLPFAKLSLAVLLVALVIGCLNLHMQTILRDHAQTALAAAGFASLYGPAQVLGRLGAGYLLDRISGPRLAAGIFLLPAVGCVLLLGAPASILATVLSPSFAGLAAGVEIDVMAYLTSRFFGVRHYGAVYGVLFGVFAWPWASARLRRVRCAITWEATPCRWKGR